MAGDDQTTPRNIRQHQKTDGVKPIRHVLGTAGFRAVTRKAGSGRARGWIVYQRDNNEINALRRLLKDDTSQHDTAIY